jgi:CheY-like chemotaxis protein
MLLVEDHADTLRVMERLTRSLGFAVQTASSLSEAMSLAERAEFDVLVSDIGLPDGSGLDLVRSLRANHLLSGGLPMPALAVSGFGTDEDRRRSHDAGFAEHLTKPIDLSQLESAIRRLVPIQAGAIGA